MGDKYHIRAIDKYSGQLAFYIKHDNARTWLYFRRFTGSYFDCITLLNSPKRKMVEMEGTTYKIIKDT